MVDRFSLKRVVLLFGVIFGANQMNAQEQQVKIVDQQKLNPTTIELQLNNKEHILIDFYGENIFRLFEDENSKTLRNPKAKPPAQILVDHPRSAVKSVTLTETADSVFINTAKVKIAFNKATSLFSVYNKTTGQLVTKSLKPILTSSTQSQLKLQAKSDEYFFGGGVQNGRFSHKGKSIAIVNQNSWTDGGVASPNPYYWSSNGYGLMWFTFKKGEYDFGAQNPNQVALTHDTDHLDVFVMVSDGAVALLNDYYQLTGNPVLLPKIGFYEGHLNAYNRDYWKKDSTGILFEDGNRYKESQKDNGGTKESLNGEKNNYQFSARAVIDRYAAHDMPLGWILPNDGYGAGYGQTETLDGNIQNLKEFGDYARAHGVQIGLWTQSDLHPKEGVEALLQRDIVKEVGVAGVRVLKTDVAWVGPGYSFGLNGIADVAQVTTKYGNNARPFIITLDGWAGTQRYAAIWSGDQTGGYWEYIRFHIPTYIGSGLSGEPNITSDMDGIFGGENIPVNVRDFQWKTFTPMQLNMDGWGSNPKYPQALGESATSINRDYLKFKSELMPYAYSIAHEAVDGLPMMRAMFLEDYNAFTLGTATKYQFMYGPSFLIAPIYQDTQADEEGNDVRHHIYLPEGTWYDYFTGEQYKGQAVLNYFDAPLWKLPIFVKPGAIIPLVNPNNNMTQIDQHQRIFELYPYGKSSFTRYNDDGKTVAYKNGDFATTLITSDLDNEKATIRIAPTQGDFDGFVKDQTTVLKFNVSEQPRKTKVRINGKRVKLQEVTSLEAFNNGTNVYYYNPAPEFNRFATEGSEFAQVDIKRNPQLWVKLDTVNVAEEAIEVQVKGYVFDIHNQLQQTEGAVTVPQNAQITDANAQPFSLTPSWDAVANANYYDIEFNGMLYTNIKDTQFTFGDLESETTYDFKVRAVNKTGHSEWASISGTTTLDPLQFAIPNIAGYGTAPSQAGFDITQLFDQDERTLWHSKYHADAIPSDVILDLRSVNTLDKLEYLPRQNGLNGVITKGSVYYSMDKKDWTKAGDIAWKRDNTNKTFSFDKHPKARYVKFSLEKGVGNYGSGRELYIFKVPGTSSYIPGDINSDGKVDQNDLTSYTNYTGLRLGDSDFEGYISKGDINKNNLIDAYDISNVTTQLNGGVRINPADTLAGSLQFKTDKTHYKKGETISLTVSGKDLKNVNALSFAMPYDTDEYEYLGIKLLNAEDMRDMTNDRLHSNGQKALYPTLVNLGNKATLNGSEPLFILTFKAKKDLNVDLKPIDGFLVDKSLEVIKF